MRTLFFIILASFYSAAYTSAAANQLATENTPAPTHTKTPPYKLETVTKGLNYPWSLTFLPNGDYLVSLRSGELRRINPKGIVSAPITNTPETYVASQGGYFDITLDPDHANNKIIYLAFAHGTAEANGTQVIKATLTATSLENVEPIFTVEPLKDTPVHYGGRLQFIGDGTLLITTGDGFEYREASQDKFNQLGKVIRINKDGSVPADNPFADGKEGNPKVYSLGHRNPQGLAYDAANNIIYMHEHGPEGGDEVNRIKAGDNYGWPATSYGKNYSGALVSPLKQAPGVTNPIKVWTPSIAPSGLTFYNGAAFPAWKGSLFVGALVDQEVSRLALENGTVKEEERLFAEINERIRDIRTGPEGYLYILTDSEQGQLIRVRPAD